jgi:hypothetical protein
MLVIGFNGANGFHFSGKLDVEVDIDSPKKIHDLLKKEAGKEMKGEGFSLVVCFDDDGYEVAVYEDGEDYDITEDDDEDLDDENEDEDPDDLSVKDDEDDEDD